MPQLLQFGKTGTYNLVLSVALATALTLSASARAQEIIVSLKPIHSIVQAVLGETGSAHLILDGVASPHTAQLRPSEADALAHAKLVIWMGPGLEPYLQRPVKNLSHDAKTLRIDQISGLVRLEVRENENFEGDHHDHGHSEEKHDDLDAHLWLDPKNGQIIAHAVAHELAELYPGNHAIYAQNADRFSQQLKVLQEEIHHDLHDIEDKRFLVFHDAYQYFEKRFGVRVVGSIAVSPEVPPGARRLRELEHLIEHENITCIFVEPQFPSKIAKQIAEAGNVKLAELDPIGAALAPGPDQYGTLVRSLSNSILDCAR